MKKGTRIFAAFFASLVLCGSVPFAEVTASGNETDFAGAEQEDILETMEQVADISSETPVEEQIVIVYDEPSKDNVKQLGIAEDTVLEGESITDQVDVLTPEESVNTDELIRELENRPGVAAVSRNDVVKVTSLPNDPYVIDGKAWQFEAVGADAVWNQVSIGAVVKVAVIDSGLNMNHEDLTGRCEIGYDFVRETSASMTDIYGHGTNVSGLIAATANNGKGIAGITGSAPVRIVAYRTGGLDTKDDKLNGSYVTAALLEVAKRDDIQVVNMSFGGESTSSTRETALKKVADSGKIMVAAAGNDGNSTINYPASSEGVISVGATDSDNNRASFSNFNRYVDLCAPGARVCTTNGSGYAIGSGTSFSAPIVAAAAAVLKCANPALTASQIEEVLIDTAIDLGASGRDNSYGHGLIQLDKALESAKGINPVKITDFHASVPSPQYPGTEIELSVSASGGMESIQYRFEAEFQDKVTVLSDYSYADTCTWTPTKVGTYTLTAYAKDSAGSVVHVSRSFTIKQNTYKITDFHAGHHSPQNIGTHIYLYAEGEGPGEPVYKFTVTSDKGTAVIQDYSDSTVADYTPAETGIYTFRVYLKDAGDADSGAVSASMEFTILDTLLVEYFNHQSYPPQEVGYDIRLTSMGSGGTGEYEYCFTASVNGTTTMIQDYGPERSVIWTPDEPGIYTLTVYIKDSSGEVVSASKEYEITINKPTAGLDPLYSPPEAWIGSAIPLLSRSYGGVGTLLHKFTVTPQNGREIILKDYSTTDRVYWKPEKTGIYLLKLYVKDENNTVAMDEIKFIISIPEEVPFTDVKKGDWFFDSAAYVYHMNIMTGLTGTTFGPGQNLARGQFATILYRMDGSPDIPYIPIYPDVQDNGAFYSVPAVWAYVTGVITGYADGSFSPSDPMTREQLATMVYRYSKYRGYDTSAKASLWGFPDQGRVSAFAREAMEWAVAEGIISGDQGKLNPQGIAARAVTAAIIMRSMESR